MPVSLLFVLEVTLQQGDTQQMVTLSSAKNSCTISVSKETKPSKICAQVAEQIASETYSDLPWINSAHTPHFIVHYKAANAEWTRETGVKPDPKTKSREALRKLAAQIIDESQKN